MTYWLAYSPGVSLINYIFIGSIYYQYSLSLLLIYISLLIHLPVLPFSGIGRILHLRNAFSDSPLAPFLGPPEAAQKFTRSSAHNSLVSSSPQKQRASSKDSPRPSSVPSESQKMVPHLPQPTLPGALLFCYPKATTSMPCDCYFTSLWLSFSTWKMKRGAPFMHL